MKRAEPTTIRVRISIEIGVDRPTAAILWKEDHVGCQRDWIVPASLSSRTEQTTKTPLQAQHRWIHIVFVINDGANDKYVATGATWMNLYHLRLRRRKEQQRRHRRRKMNDFVSSLSSTMKRTAKTPPPAQPWLNCIGFVVINNEANDKDAAAGAVAAAVPDDATDRIFYVPCIGGPRLMMKSMWSPGRRGHQTTTSTTSNAPKSMKSMKSMKEQYYCYVIDVWRRNMIVTL